MKNNVLLIYEQELKKIQELLRELLIESQVKCALLISRHDGSMLWQQGDTVGLDTVSLAALTSAGFSATKEIARLIGEPEFSMLFHQGENSNIHINLVGEDALLMLIFDNRTTVGLVKVLAKEACQKLAKIIAPATG